MIMLIWQLQALLFKFNHNTMVEISVSIEGIAFENFSAVPQADINSYTISRQRHAVFKYFFI